MTKQLICGRRMAALVLGKNERTIRRLCDDGALPVVGFVDRNSRKMAMVKVTDVLAILGERKIVEPELAELIADADQGKAEAQNDLAITLLQEERSSAAFTLFNAAAEQDYPDAMHWLYQCYQNGIGIARDEKQAMMWLNKAADYGHKIAKLQVVATAKK